MPSNDLQVDVQQVFLLPGIGVVADGVIIEGTLRRGTRVRVQSTGEIAVVGAIAQGLRPVAQAGPGDHVGIRLEFPYVVRNEAWLPAERNFRHLIHTPDSLHRSEDVSAVLPAV
jgi:translation initiation factor IF-2